MTDLNKIGPLNEIKYLGNWEVLCKQPASNKNQGCTYGTFSPADFDIEINEIKEKIKILRRPDSQMKEIAKLKKLKKGSRENNGLKC